MSTIINNYPVFEDNQVLTSGQLNQMIKYLDQQNRLTRVSLIGMGIVCGMKVSCETVDSKTTLTISKGVGITSEGFLIGIGDCHTTRYREYNMLDTVIYPPFDHEELELYELLTETAITQPEEEITDLDESFLSDKVVLLFLECFDKDLKSCLGKSCDELGIDRIFTLRKLLITKEQLENLVWPEIEGGKADASYPDKNLLPPFLWVRPLMDTEVNNYHEMGIRYLSALTSDNFLTMLAQTYDIYEPVLSEIYHENPFTSSVITGKISQIIGYMEAFIAMEEPVYGIQYIYDFVKDLGLAYKEFRDVSFDLSSICCPDMDRFPKHLMLGEACGSEVNVCVPLKYRNEFVSSPVLSQQHDLVEKIRFLHKRIVLMIESLDLDRLSSPEKWPLKITPSCEKKGTLSQRTIPIYYDTKKESAYENAGTLEQTWNYEIYRRCNDSDFPKQLSYDNHEFGQEPEHPIVTPLGFELDQFNFLRIEGILAKPVDEVRESIEKAKAQWNLSFDLKAIHFGELMAEKPVPDCLVADLQSDYAIWRNKLLLILNNIVRANKSAEEIILNRDDYGEVFERKNRKGFSNTSRTKNTSSSAGLFNRPDFANIADEGMLDFNQLSYRVFEAEIRLADISKRGKAKRSASFTTREDTTIKGLFSDLNSCLLGLIKAMPEDFKDFSMREWLDKYKCVLRVYISLMKFWSTYAVSNVLMIRMMVIIMILCLLFDVIRFIAIYPYITIRTLYDTLQERIDQLAASLEFHNFFKNYPGMNHKAGVTQGDTFILVYESAFAEFGNPNEKTHMLLDRLENQQLFGYKGQDLKIEQPGSEQLASVFKEMEGQVIADFTLPFICCDECGNLSHTPLPLDPLVTPICGIISFADQKFSSHRPFTKMVLNNLYDPALYKVSLITDPKLGTAELTETSYLPDPSKKSQVLNYTVDPELLEQEKETNESYIFIDEIEYQVTDISKNEVVGEDVITIFIPVVREEQASIAGTVTASDASGNQVGVFEARISVVGTALSTTTNEDGTYTLPAVPVAQHNMTASHSQFGEATKEVTIIDGENTVDFQLQLQASFGVLTGTVLVKTANGNSPVPGASVSIIELEMVTTTNRSGGYSFAKVPYGSFKVSATYGDFRQEVTANINHPQNVTNIVFESQVKTGVVKGSVKAILANGEERGLPKSTVEIYNSEAFKTRKGLPQLTGTTLNDGSFSLEDVPAGKYLGRAFHSGFYSEEQAIVVRGGETQQLNFSLKTSPKIDISFDRIYKSFEVAPDTPEAKNIEDYYASKMGNYKREAEKIEERLGGTELTAVAKANGVIKEFSDEKDINVVKLNNDYNSLRNELVKGWDKSSGKEKELHAEALQNLTNAYLERLAFTQPDRLTNTSIDVLRETGSIINDNKDLNVKEAVQNWLRSSEGYVTNDYRSNVKRYMNIK
ncbi:MAG: carboxypeptidase-like regulatory domain-containing protein [Cyclobacteriaceae bacterium]